VEKFGSMNTNAFINRVVLATSTIICVLALIYLFYLARTPLLWIGIAAFFAVAINPLVHRVAKFMPKQNIGLATLAILGTVTILALVLGYIFLAPLVQQTSSLIASIPELAKNAAKTLTNSPLAQNMNISQSDIEQYIQGNLSNIVLSASAIGGALINLLLSIMNSIIALVAISTMIFFMSSDGKNLKNIAIKSINPKNRTRIGNIGNKVYGIITGYVVGNIILSAVFGVCSALLLWAMGSPYWIPLGLMAGLIDLIPLVGSTIAAAIIAVISLLSGDPTTALVFAIFTILYVQLESNVLNPMVYSKSVDISPLIVLISILLGGAMAGIIGALIAIPVAATVQVIAKELLKDRLNSK
jgi:predicted PurR-regulated permease PerM